MHQSVYEFVQTLLTSSFKKYFTKRKVCEIGSLDLNGTIRYNFQNCEYIGVDLGEGKGVDVVSKGHEYDKDSEYFDVVHCTEVFEHDMYYKKTLQNMVRILKPKGLMFFTCATTGRLEHGTIKAGDIEESSPFLVEYGEEWCNYYKNLTEDDIREVLDVDSIFEHYQFSKTGPKELWMRAAEDKEKMNDLRFWGIKR